MGKKKGEAETMEKFSELQYVRPDMEKVLGDMRAVTEALKNAADFGEFKAAYMDYVNTDIQVSTARQLAHIRNKEIGFIFQGYNLIQELDALENVTLPLIYQGVSVWDREDIAMEALEKVGMAERAHHRPSEMSGGQQQRVAIARAIATHPPIIMADEPTGALDSKTGAHVLEILRDLYRGGTTVILITHDNGIAATARRVVRLSDGRVISDEAQEVDWQ